MKILITAGGTIVKIDDVRYLSNFSTGSFATKLANANLAKGHTVIYLHAKTAIRPTNNKKLNLFEFETYDEYAEMLQKILINKNLDIVYLCAAVSDFGVKQSIGKIKSSQKKITLCLYRLPKVIQMVKRWSTKPIFQVGFKLETSLGDAEWIEVAYKSGIENRSDLTVANDLLNIHSGRKRQALLITPEKGVINVQDPNVAEKLVDFVEKRARVSHFHTTTISNKTLNKQYNKEIKLMKELCGKLSIKGLMPEYYQGAFLSHGSLALRVDSASMLITARKCDKHHLKSNDIVLVREVDWKNREIVVESSHNQKASFNAVLVSAIFRKFPTINAVVHTHSFAKNASVTEFPYTPGTYEYATMTTQLFRGNTRMINIKNHGLVAIGSDLIETVNYVLN